MSGFSPTATGEHLARLAGCVPANLPISDSSTTPGFHRYSLTFCTDGKRPVFRSEAAVKLVLAQISRASDVRQFAVIAYCFMPDHLHISLAKQYSSYYDKREFGMTLWQRYGYERTLRKEEQTAVAARYILENLSAQSWPTVSRTIRSSDHWYVNWVM